MALLRETLPLSSCQVKPEDPRRILQPVETILDAAVYQELGFGHSSNRPAMGVHKFHQAFEELSGRAEPAGQYLCCRLGVVKATGMGTADGSDTSRFECMANRAIQRE